MLLHIRSILLACALLPGMIGATRADDRLVRLAAPAKLTESGLLQYALPRFSLKHRVRIKVVAPGSAAEISLSADDGEPTVFFGPDTPWRMSVLAPGHQEAQKLANWLTSKIGQRTITGFTVNGIAPFRSPGAKHPAAIEEAVDGDVSRGKDLALTHCGRCHVVASENRMGAIGSTPSFRGLRTLPQWKRRFEAFFTLNPHPAFTQIEGVTVPFSDSNPPPIVPLRLTLADLNAILAYVAALSPSDLGAQLKHQ